MVLGSASNRRPLTGPVSGPASGLAKRCPLIILVSEARPMKRKVSTDKAQLVAGCAPLCECLGSRATLLQERELQRSSSFASTAQPFRPRRFRGPASPLLNPPRVHECSTPENNEGVSRLNVPKGGGFRAASIGEQLLRWSYLRSRSAYRCAYHR
jgi:hypothetical protein